MNVGDITATGRCDRCGHTKTVDADDIAWLYKTLYALRWTEIRIFDFTAGVTDTRAVTLCNSCYDDLDTFIAGKRVPKPRRHNPAE